MSMINPGAGIIISSSTALLTSIAILITNEYISKLKIRYTKLRDWINIITLLIEKTLKESMIDKVINQKEADQLKQIYNHYVDEKSEIMKNTSFKIEDIFNDVINKIQYHKNKYLNFFSQNDVNININIKFNVFKPKKEKIKNYEPSAPPYYE